MQEVVNTKLNRIQTWHFQNLFFVLCVLMTVGQVRSQTPEPIRLYNEGIAQYNLKNYLVADSLFGASLKLHPDKDTYFNRALCNGKAGNRVAYCFNLVFADWKGKVEARTLYMKGCGRIDSSYVKLNQWEAEHDIFSQVFTYSFCDSVQLQFVRTWASQIDPTKGQDSLSRASEISLSGIKQQAEFPGGTGALFNFIKLNNKLNRKMDNEENSAVVYVRFVVNESGWISHIQPIKLQGACDECVEEACRLVAIMPRWKPATKNGTAVRCYFSLPIKFGSRPMKQ